MPGAPLFIHIGLQKTGTSYLQSIFWQNRDALRDQGLDMVPPSKRQTFWLQLRVRERYNPELDPPGVGQALERLPKQLAEATSPRALISEESLAPAKLAQIRGLVEACGDREVHVVVTVRDLARQTPSAWQQNLQNGEDEPFEDYLHRLRETEGKSYLYMWRNKDVVAVLERWRKVVPAERIHVVTVPPPGSDPELLLQRFCRVVGVDPERLDREVAVSNSSLGLVHAEVVRRVNANLDEEHRLRNVYGDVGKRYLAVEVLGEGGGERVRMPRELQLWCAEVSRRYADHIAAGGYQVVGDLDDLLPHESSFVDTVTEPSEREVADAATAALAAVLTDQMDRLRERRAQKVRRAAGPPDAPDPGKPQDAEEPPASKEPSPGVPLARRVARRAARAARLRRP